MVQHNPLINNNTKEFIMFTKQEIEAAIESATSKLEANKHAALVRIADESMYNYYLKEIEMLTKSLEKLNELLKEK